MTKTVDSFSTRLFSWPKNNNWVEHSNKLVVSTTVGNHDEPPKSPDRVCKISSGIHGSVYSSYQLSGSYNGGFIELKCSDALISHAQLATFHSLTQ